MKKRLLIVTVILAILAILLGAAYLCWFVPARNMSQMNACKGTMRALSSSIEQWSMASHATNGIPIDSDQMLKYFKGHAMPACPAGGEYSVTVIGEPPSCSVHGMFGNVHFPDGTVPEGYHQSRIGSNIELNRIVKSARCASLPNG